MLDYDLAEIYGYKVKRLNEQVKRNIARFSEDFMFQLTKDEIDFVKSQIATSRNYSMYEGQDGGRRKAPYAFTEQGIYMLATVLRGEIAEQQGLHIHASFYSYAERQIRSCVPTTFWSMLVHSFFWGKRNF